MKKTSRILVAALAGAMALSLTTPVRAEKISWNLPSMEDVETIQPILDGTIYGNHLVEVQVTYKDGVDLSGINADSYILEDRGTVTPEFGKVAIGDVTVEGQVVTIEVPMVTAATANNDLVYSGVGAGARQRNSFGASVTGPWYRDPDGQIFFGKEDTEEYKANWSGMGYQKRPTLELKLRHADETPETAVAMADEKGQFVEGTQWLPQIDRQFEGWQTFEEAGIQIPTTANKEVVTDGTGDDWVRGIFYVPENYDPEAGIVFVEQGQGIVYWQLQDGSNNYLTSAYFDTATTSWANTGAIVVHIDDRSSAGPGDYFEVYDFVADDVAVMKYFIDTYGVTGNIVVQGNSRGTFACDLIIKALAGRPYHPWEQAPGRQGYEKDHLLDKEVYDFTVDCYICQNGDFGKGIAQEWDDEDIAAIIATGMKAWVFDGEQDTNNIESVAKWYELGGAEGSVRHSGYPSNIYYFWGESDHSTTRINGWYFADEPFYGPAVSVDAATGELVYSEKLADGDKYTLPGRGGAAAKQGYEYTIYEDSFHTWALEK